MPSVCFYFQVHQPFRIKHYSVFDIGKDHFYEDGEKNKWIMDSMKMAKKINGLWIRYLRNATCLQTRKCLS